MRRVLGRLFKYPEVAGGISGFFLASSILFGFWIGIAPLWRDAERAQQRLLTECFSDPLARAIGTGDDLARVDLLKRLEKMPPVVSAELVPTTSATKGAALRWEGNLVGRLVIRRSAASRRRSAHRSVEQAGGIAILCSAFGAGAGWIMRRFRIRTRRRLRVLIAKIGRAHRRRTAALELRAREESLRWTLAAMNLQEPAMVLLDAHQRLIAFNSRAQRSLALTPEALGQHWLEMQRDPEWAIAFERSLQDPEKPVPGPALKPFTSRVTTFFGPLGQPESTWLTFH